jgi:hypothetical protein
MTDNEISSNRVRGMLGLPLQAWENLMVGSLAFAAFAAAVVGVSTWAVVRLQRQELTASKLEFDSYKLETGKRIADANAAGESAKADAAEANKKAEGERLERLKLEALVAPRRLTADEKRTIAAGLISFSGRRVRIKSYALDTESAVLGQQIIEIFAAVHIGVDDRRMSDGSLGSIATGVRITGDDGLFVAALLRAFSNLGHLVVSPEAPPPATGLALGDDGTDVQANIFVGVKPISP